MICVKYILQFLTVYTLCSYAASDKPDTKQTDNSRIDRIGELLTNQNERIRTLENIVISQKTEIHNLKFVVSKLENKDRFHERKFLRLSQILARSSQNMATTTVYHIEQNEVSSQNQSDSEENSEVDESDSSDLQPSRMDNLAWDLLYNICKSNLHCTKFPRCDCNNCTVMPTVDECICWKEVGPVADKKENGDLECITDHEGFTGNSLNRHVIEVSLYDFVETQGPVDDDEPIHE
ncbi:unnamed protein product [Mytilus coruscus]|uniref:Uncharacterized protein n=1 Tax=Mytilus coruscus TaxID=42192 RepID=A0A6J8F277_MYTCO|nr:unnamed protein product [Mytilus coruscus]